MESECSSERTAQECSGHIFLGQRKRLLFAGALPAEGIGVSGLEHGTLGTAAAVLKIQFGNAAEYSFIFDQGDI